jgi:hypothetical protein
MERASEMFEEKFHGNPNIFTPDVIRYEMLSGTVAVELSEGEDFEHKPLVGTTFLVRTVDGQLRSGTQAANQCFQGNDALNEAEDHIERVKNILLGGGE